MVVPFTEKYRIVRIHLHEIQKNKHKLLSGCLKKAICHQQQSTMSRILSLLPLSDGPASGIIPDSTIQTLQCVFPQVWLPLFCRQCTNV